MQPPEVDQPTDDSSSEPSPSVPDRARFRIIGGILGLVGAAVRLAGTIYWLGPYNVGFRNWVGALAWPLIVALFSVLVLAAGRRWPLLGAGGLLSLGLYIIWVFFPAYVDLLKEGSQGWSRSRWDVTSVLVAGGIVLVGGLVALLERDRERATTVNVTTDSPGGES